MSRSALGWSLPPGAAGDPRAPWNQDEGPCSVCGKSVDDCICPECPHCHAVGDPFCYDGEWQLLVRRTSMEDRGIYFRGTCEEVLRTKPPAEFATLLTSTKSHGLVRNAEQLASAAEAAAALEADHRAIAEYEAKLDADQRYAEGLWDQPDQPELS